MRDQPGLVVVVAEGDLLPEAVGDRHLVEKLKKKLLSCFFSFEGPTRTKPVENYLLSRISPCFHQDQLVNWVEWMIAEQGDLGSIPPFSLFGDNWALI